MGVGDLVGKQGDSWLSKTVRAMTYDPATTFQEVQQAAQRISEAKRKLIEFKSAATTVGLKSSQRIDAPTPYLINVIFTGGASIKNVRDWKKTATDWELIVSGVAGVLDEKPEEIAVIGATNGSIIFTLSATLGVTKLLATISKHIASIANDYQDFQLKREDLERSRLMTDVIRNEFSRLEKDRRIEGKNTILSAVKAHVPNAMPEALTKLEKAIDKHISFSESGGEVDFITPPMPDDEVINFDDSIAETVQELRDLIQEYRNEKRNTKLLTQYDDKTGEDD